jgi:hypothetical protein
VQKHCQRIARHRVQLVAVELTPDDLAIDCRPGPAREIDMRAAHLGLGGGQTAEQNGKREG